MSRWRWTPIRHVAENIAAGDRDYWNLLKIPELGYSRASDAIREIEKQGAITVTGNRVEPTAAFPDWLADLRRREDNPESAGPAKAPKVDGSALEAVTAEAPAPKQARVRKRYFQRLSKGRHQAGLEMAGRIKDVLERHGGSMRLSTVRRAVHGDRHPEAWKEGIRRLVVHQVATIAERKIALIWSDTIVLPDPYMKPVTAKRWRRRRSTEWFERNRPKMDAGQHSGFDNDSDVEDESD